jgi:hypothetical protein
MVVLVHYLAPALILAVADHALFAHGATMEPPHAFTVQAHPVPEKDVIFITTQDIVASNCFSEDA